MAKLGFKSDTGPVRERNEDACFVMPAHNVYVVADGVGGNNAGDVASMTVVRGVAEYVDNRPIENCETDEDIFSYFIDCLAEVNTQVYKAATANSDYNGMASTVVLAYIRDNMAYIMNVGDSRAYIFRDGSLHQLTEDHTYVNELVKGGVITEEEARTHVHRNMITRAIGAEVYVKSDYFRVPVEKDDVLMLCSDGLYGEVEEQRLIEILDENTNLREACDVLVDAAVEGGGRDNITVICVRV